LLGIGKFERKRTMAIEIPDVFGAGLINLTACGEIRPKGDEQLQKWVKDHSDKFFIYRVVPPNGEELVYRVSLDDFKDFLHVHVDFATKEFFEGRKFPEASKNVPTFDDLLHPFVGRELQVDISADFIRKLDDLPSTITFISKASVKTKELTIRITGATLSIDGSPIEKVSWMMDADQSRATINMHGKTALQFAATYFVDCLRFVSQYSRPFLEKEETNA